MDFRQELSPAEDLATKRPTGRDVGDDNGCGDFAHIPEDPVIAIGKKE